MPQVQPRQYYDEAFSYSRGGLIVDKFFTQDGESRRERYEYDPTARLTLRRDLTWSGAKYPPEQVHLFWRERVSEVCRHTIMRNDRCDGAQSESRCMPWWSRGNAVE